MAACLASGGGCGSIGTGAPIKNEPQRPAGEQTLYQRLGGAPALTAIVDDWIERALRNPQVNFTRQGQPHPWQPTPDNLAQLKIYWTQYIEMLCDGPQIYEGRDLFTTHSGMRISESEWLALMQDLQRTLAALHEPVELERQLMRRVAGTHDAIVNQ
jgi:hemoglobin